MVQSERQARELAQVPEAKRVEVLQEAKRNGAITAKSIRAAVTRVVYDEEALDVDDIPIPKPAIKYWNRRDEAKGILRQISSIRIEIEKLLPDDPMWCEVNLNGVLADLSSAINRKTHQSPSKLYPNMAQPLNPGRQKLYPTRAPARIHWANQFDLH